MAGMLVADGGLGLTSGEPVTQWHWSLQPVQLQSTHDRYTRTWPVTQSDTEVYNQYNYKVHMTDTLGPDL